MSAREAGAITIRRAGGRMLPFILLAMLLLAVPSAEAQITPFGVSVTSSGNGQLTATDLACVREQVTVTNTGQSPIPPEHRIVIATTGPGPGWDVVQAPPDALSLAAGASTSFPIELCPGADIEDGATTQYGITATVSSDINSQPASNTLTFTITATDDSVLGLDIPNSALWIALAGVAALVALVLLTRSRSTGGVAISCPEASKTVAPGRGTSFPIRIRNDGRGKDVVSLSTTPVPPGWDTFLPLVDIPLEPREEQTVWLSVKSPDDAESGDHLVVKVTARSSSAAGEQATIDTLTTVRAPAAKQVTPPADADAESSVYGDEGGDEDAEEPRPVAVKRRKS